MSNETDLDWLARNVHEWPAGEHQPWCYVYMTYGGGMKAAGNFLDAVANPAMITIDQWISRRAELQNKPGWDKAEDWAEWLAQDEDGEWKWLAGLPGKYVDGWTAVKIKGCCKGSALGDWRDTLEKRPVDLSEQAVTERLTEATQTVLAAAPALMDEKFRFDRDDWFERGELPPVGVECDIRHSCWNSEKYEKVTVAAITNEYLIVKYATFEQHYMLKDISFHPLRTERDVLLSVIVEEMNRYDTDGKLADAILAAGFSLRDK